MKDEFEYQDALNLFEKVYYTRDGEGKELDTEDGWFGAVEKPKLMNLALKLGDRDYKSKIIGRSAFTPIIKKVLVTQEKKKSKIL